MTPTQLEALFRSDVRDEATPYLWSTVEVFNYMDDAQKMFTRLTGGIADSSTPEIAQIALTTGESYAAYDPRILKLRSARLASNGRTVEILNFEDLEDHRPSDYGSFTSGDALNARPGPVRAVVTGMDATKLRLINTPIADDTLNVIVYRMPLETLDATSVAFEIDEQHHRYLMHWMKHLAFTKQDAETYDRGRSTEFRDTFFGYCDQVKAERERREHKYRSVSYGGI